MYMGEGRGLCIISFQCVHTFNKISMKGVVNVKMTKDEAKAIAKKGIEHSKKYGIPLKEKKKK